MWPSRKNQAFSLIEIIVYVAIFSMISIVVINSFIVTLSAYQTTRTNRNLQESGANVMERMSREIRQAKSVGGTAGYELSLIKEDSLGNDQTILFKGEYPGIINLYQDGVLIDNLMSENILGTQLSFDKIVTANGSAIRIQLTIKDLNDKSEKSASFQNTILLRGAYK